MCSCPSVWHLENTALLCQSLPLALTVVRLSSKMTPEPWEKGWWVYVCFPLRTQYSKLSYSLHTDKLRSHCVNQYLSCCSIAMMKHYDQGNL